MAPTFVLRETDPVLARRYAAEGWWTDESLGAYIDTRVRAHADLELRLWSATRPFRSTWGDVLDAAYRFAGALVARGVQPGDAVAFQLPNCPEAAAVFWGAALAGAVVVPIVHFYGPKEVDFITGVMQPAVFVRAEDVLSGPPLTIAGFLDDPSVPPIPGPVAVDPSSAALVAFTSGTTADPKGVIHTHRSIVAEVGQLGDIQPRERRPLLVGAPVGHAIGMLSALLLPLHLAQPIHLIDVWNPAMILDAMIEGKLSAGSGATYFLTSLFDAPGFTPEHAARMQYVGLGGSSVPEAVADRAIAAGISISRSYGSTEHPSVTGAPFALPQHKRKATDGRPMVGVEVRIVDEDGRDLPPGTPGEIWSRGPDLCAGYTDPALTADAFDAEGWYHTGDVGVLDADGWLTITDRIRDIIIRAGETISPAEIEDVLLRYPGLAEVAVVAAPDARLGEHACAFVRLVDPAAPPPTLDDLRGHLAAIGLAKQKWPEELRIVTDLPRTPSGKVRKFELRDQLRADAPRPT